MKKFLLAAALFISASAFAHTPAVDESVEKLFRESFPTASKVQWYDRQNGYEVLFVHNQVQCRIQYDLEGNMMHMRRDYNEDGLPLFIIGNVKKQHPTKKIYGVTEITSPEGLQYHIILEDQKHWTFIESSSGGHLSYVKRLRKA
jgi:hypothetical protein